MITVMIVVMTMVEVVMVVVMMVVVIVIVVVAVVYGGELGHITDDDGDLTVALQYQHFTEIKIISRL